MIIILNTAVCLYNKMLILLHCKCIYTQVLKSMVIQSAGRVISNPPRGNVFKEPGT